MPVEDEESPLLPAQPSTSGVTSGVTQPALTEQDKSLRYAYNKNQSRRGHHCSSDHYADSSDYSGNNVEHNENINMSPIFYVTNIGDNVSRLLNFINVQKYNIKSAQLLVHNTYIWMRHKHVYNIDIYKYSVFTNNFTVTIITQLLFIKLTSPHVIYVVNYNLKKNDLI